MQHGLPANLNKRPVKAGPMEDKFLALTWKIEFHHLSGEKHAAARGLEPFGEIKGGHYAQLLCWTQWSKIKNKINAKNCCKNDKNQS